MGGGGEAKCYFRSILNKNVIRSTHVNVDCEKLTAASKPRNIHPPHPLHAQTLKMSAWICQAEPLPFRSPYPLGTYAHIYIYI